MKIERSYKAIMTAATILAAGPALSQDYPTDVVTIVVGSSPGGSTDAVARIVANELGKKWGKPVVVENREGAMNTIAAGYVAEAKPDGHTLLMASPQHTQAPAQMQLAFDVVTGFAPITMIDTYATYLVVNSSIPVEDTAGLIAYAKENQGMLNYGSAGRGSGQYRNTVTLMEMTGIDLAEITYSGGSEANLALMGNEVQTTFSSLSGVRGMEEDKIKVLGVTTAEPSRFLPDVPPLGVTAGLEGFDEYDWHGMFAPAGTPPEVIEKIAADVKEALTKPEVAAMLEGLGVEPVLNTPAEFSKFVTSDVAKWKEFFANRTN